MHQTIPANRKMIIIAIPVMMYFTILSAIFVNSFNDYYLTYQIHFIKCTVWLRTILKCFVDNNKMVASPSGTGGVLLFLPVPFTKFAISTVNYTGLVRLHTIQVKFTWNGICKCKYLYSTIFIQ